MVRTPMQVCTMSLACAMHKPSSPLNSQGRARQMTGKRGEHLTQNGFYAAPQGIKLMPTSWCCLHILRECGCATSRPLNAMLNHLQVP